MKRLTFLGRKYGTDKATQHLFTEIYDSIFAKYKNPNILELGVDRGASLQMYNDFYRGACNIVGLDINNLYKGNGENIKVIIGDSMRTKDLRKCVNVLGEYDIILDDASHYMENQQKSFCYLFNYLKESGVYILEDLHTSFNTNFNPNKIPTTLELLDQLKKGEYITHSPYVSFEDFYRLKKQIKNIKIFTTTNTKSFEKSMTSVIKKH